MGYKYLEHTADAKFQATGKTLEEAFTHAAYAMFDLLYDHEKVKPKINMEIEVEASKDTALLYDFLDEFIYMMEVDFFLLHKVESIKITEDKDKFLLHANLVGDDLNNYKFRGDIKAMTYNDMFIKKDKAGYTLQVVVDI